jgi:type I restriction enzyme S subunit
MTSDRIRLRFVAPLRPKTPPRTLTGDVAFLPMEAIGEDGTFDRDSVRPASELENGGYTYFEEGDVLRARVTPCFENRKGALATSVAGGKGLGTTELFVFTPTQRIDPRFLYYVTVSDEFTEQGTATLYGAHGVRRVEEQFARDYRVWLPSMETQRATADHLDRELARLDALLGSKQRMIALLEERVSVAFGCAVAKHGFVFPSKLNDSWREWPRPAGWQVMHLSQALVDLTNGYVGPTRDILVDDGVRYIQSLHIKNGTIDFGKRPYYVDESWHAARPRIHLREGDVLIVQTGDVGQVAVVPPSFGAASCHALQIARVRPDLLTGRYLGAYLRSPYGRHSLISRATGALHPHLEAGIKDVPVVVPPKPVQDLIVEEVARAEDEASRLLSIINRQTDLLAERRRALATAAVTGQLSIPVAS